MNLEINSSLAQAVQDKLPLLPITPGVYIMKDAKDGIIYIGEAVNLRNRVRGYFTGPAADNHLAASKKISIKTLI